MNDTPSASAILRNRPMGNFEKLNFIDDKIEFPYVQPEICLGFMNRLNTDNPPLPNLFEEVAPTKRNTYRVAITLNLIVNSS